MNTRPTFAAPRPITYADLAEFAETMGLPGAAHFRESATAELEGLRGAQEELDRIRDLLGAIPEPPPSTKHGGTCWQRHAKCLAGKLDDQ